MSIPSKKEIEALREEFDIACDKIFTSEKIEYPRIAIADWWLNKMKLKEAHDLSAIIEWVKKQDIKVETNGNFVSYEMSEREIGHQKAIDLVLAHLTSLKEQI